MAWVSSIANPLLHPYEQLKFPYTGDTLMVWTKIQSIHYDYTLVVTTTMDSGYTETDSYEFSGATRDRRPRYTQFGIFNWDEGGYQVDASPWCSPLLHLEGPRGYDNAFSYPGVLIFSALGTGVHTVVWDDGMGGSGSFEEPIPYGTGRMIPIRRNDSDPNYRYGSLWLINDVETPWANFDENGVNFSHTESVTIPLDGGSRTSDYNFNLIITTS